MVCWSLIKLRIEGVVKIEKIDNIWNGRKQVPRFSISCVSCLDSVQWDHRRCLNFVKVQWKIWKFLVSEKVATPRAASFGPPLVQLKCGSNLIPKNSFATTSVRYQPPNSSLEYSGLRSLLKKFCPLSRDCCKAVSTQSNLFNRLVLYSLTKWPRRKCLGIAMSPLCLTPC